MIRLFENSIRKFDSIIQFDSFDTCVRFDSNEALAIERITTSTHLRAGAATKLTPLLFATRLRKLAYENT